MLARGVPLMAPALAPRLTHALLARMDANALRPVWQAAGAFRGRPARLGRDRRGGPGAHVEQRIAAASIEQIDLWTMRILSATTLAEVFAD